MTEKEINFVLIMMVASGWGIGLYSLSVDSSSKVGGFIFQFGISLVIGAMILAQILQ